jgi:hypothetical protein
MKYLLSALPLILISNASSGVIPQESAISSPISSSQNVVPYIIPPADGNERGGNRTCADVGKAYYGNPLYFQCYTDKQDYPFANNPTTFVPSEMNPIECANVINVEVVDNTFINWSSDNPIGAAIIKGGDNANTYVYDPQVNSDVGLASPINASGNPANLSNIGGFCWNPQDTNQECFEDETAWAFGNRYVRKGNWATYTIYEPNKIVTLFAGQTLEAGQVTFGESIDGVITISIQLFDDWVFSVNYELDENGNIILDENGEPIRDNNIKVQDYEMTPTGNPAPGLFNWKTSGIGQYKEIVVPINNFYGVHVDVAIPVECN